MVLPFAADAAPGDAQFPIRAYQFDGTSRFSAQELEAAVAPYIGADQTFASIQQAAKAVQRLYADIGLKATQVRIPQQQIKDGIVQLKVIETRIGKISITGQRHFDEANIRASLPALQEGSAPDLDAVTAALRLSNESYAKQTQLTLSQGERPDLLDALIDVADNAPLRQIVTFNNTGTSQTGRHRIGYAFQNANLFNRDHLLTAQFVTSPNQPGRVAIFGVNYRLPFYTVAGAIDIHAGHSSVNSGVVETTAGSYAVSGSGNSAGIMYSQLLARLADWEQRISFGYDYRHYRNDVTADGSASLIPDVVVQPLSLTYTGFARAVEREWGGAVSYHRNLPSGGKGSTSAFRLPGGRAEASANYQLWRFNAYLRQQLPFEWQLRAQISGQETRHALVPGEQFGVGGVDSVRGFNEREITGDRGRMVSVEVHGPNVGKGLDYPDFQLHGLAFYDAGDVKRNRALPGEVRHASIASTGLGLRAGIGTWSQIRIDLAHVLRGGGIRKPGEKMLHVGITCMF